MSARENEVKERHGLLMGAQWETSLELMELYIVINYNNADMDRFTLSLFMLLP